MSVLIKFILYLNREKHAKFIIRPVKVGFLYIEVMNLLLFLLISIFRKPTFTGLMINFASFSPFKYKINLIKTLIHRAYYISSSFIISNTVTHLTVVYIYYLYYFLNNNFYLKPKMKAQILVLDTKCFDI